MNSIKNITLERIKNLTDNITLEDLMYEINAIAQVLDGVRDEEEGRILLKKNWRRASKNGQNNMDRKGRFALGSHPSVYFQRFHRLCKPIYKDSNFKNSNTILTAA
ncbi:MAG: hypothetical protein JXD23_12535 [Spirochaetales bacterium]|nr:hypothetical protein [Spirochaetales bacterium]